MPRSIGRILPRTSRIGRPRLPAALESLVLFVAAVLSDSAVLAATDTAQAHFATGNRAFQAQDYRSALQSYESALAAGLSGPAIHFNLGVVAYRLGDYERAHREFEQVAQTPSMAALAHYNEGLVELQQGKQTSARSWFERARDEADDERLRALAEAQLAGLSLPAERNWVGYAAAGFGYDDNVALVSNNDVLGVSHRSDAFADIAAAITGPIDRAWSFDGSVAATQYRRLDDFDQVIAAGGARYTFVPLPWSPAIGAEFAHTQLGGHGFENRLALGVQAVAPLSHDWSLWLGYRYLDLDGLDGFSAVDGTRREARARFHKDTNHWDVAFGYEFENSDYRDDALSVRRHKLSIDYERALTPAWRAQANAAVRFSDYDLGSHGTEHRFEIGVAVKRQLTPIWRITARYDYATNDARLDDFDYRRNRIWMGIEATL